MNQRQTNVCYRCTSFGDVNCDFEMTVPCTQCKAHNLSKQGDANAGDCYSTSQTIEQYRETRGGTERNSRRQHSPTPPGDRSYGSPPGQQPGYGRDPYPQQYHGLGGLRETDNRNQYRAPHPHRCGDDSWNESYPLREPLDNAGDMVTSKGSGQSYAPQVPRRPPWSTNSNTVSRRLETVEAREYRRWSETLEDRVSNLASRMRALEVSANNGRKQGLRHREDEIEIQDHHEVVQQRDDARARVRQLEQMLLSNNIALPPPPGGQQYAGEMVGDRYQNQNRVRVGEVDLEHSMTLMGGALPPRAPRRGPTPLNRQAQNHGRGVDVERGMNLMGAGVPPAPAQNQQAQNQGRARDVEREMDLMGATPLPPYREVQNQGHVANVEHGVELMGGVAPPVQNQGIAVDVERGMELMGGVAPPVQNQVNAVDIDRGMELMGGALPPEDDTIDLDP